MSDPYEEAFEEVLQAERERQPVFVVGMPASSKKVCVCVGTVAAVRDSDIVVQSGSHVWCVDKKNVYNSHAIASAALLVYRAAVGLA